MSSIEKQTKLNFYTRISHQTSIVQENRDKYLNMPINEKRDVYACQSNYTELFHISTWPEYYQENEFSKRSENN